MQQQINKYIVRLNWNLDFFLSIQFYPFLTSFVEHIISVSTVIYGFHFIFSKGLRRYFVKYSICFFFIRYESSNKLKTFRINRIYGSYNGILRIASLKTFRIAFMAYDEL